MDAPRIRPATVDDGPALVDLNRQLGYPTTEAELCMRLELILASANDGVLIAIEDTRPIGWVHVAIERTLETTDGAVLRGLVVDEARRSRGVGLALLNAAEAWASQHGCVAVTVRSRVARERAHRFYEREGYVHVKTSHVFTKPLV